MAAGGSSVTSRPLPSALPTLSQLRVWAGEKRKAVQSARNYLGGAAWWMRSSLEAPPDSPIGWRETLIRIDSHYQLRVRNPKAWSESDVRRDVRRISALSVGIDMRGAKGIVHVTVPDSADVRSTLATVEAVRSWPTTQLAPVVVHLQGDGAAHWEILTSIPGVSLATGGTSGPPDGLALVAGALPTPGVHQIATRPGRDDQPRSARRLLILMQRLPDLTRSSSGQDVYWFARHAAAVGYEPLVMPLRPRPDDDASRWALRAAGVAVVSGRRNRKALERALPATLVGADVVAIFDKELVVPARRLAWSEGTRVPILFLPLDLKRFPMQAIIDAGLGPELAEFGFAVPTEDDLSRLVEAENAAIEGSDVTAVISSDELQALQGEWDSAKLAHLPMLRTPPRWVADASSEPRIVFVGGFNHPPNYIALQWFFRTVWPIVLAHRPHSTIEVFGADLRTEWRDRWSQLPGVHIEGPYEAEEAPYGGDVVAVAPLPYGGGTKGKVVGAIGHGAVVVGTRYASQGLPEDMRSAVSQADTSEDFAQKLLALLASGSLREEYRQRGRVAFDRSFSTAAGERSVRECLSRVTELGNGGPVNV